MQETTNVTQPPTTLYQGYDSFQGQARNTLVSGLTNITNGQTYTNVTVCTDTSSVQQALSASASVSDGFADFSVSASAKFAQSLNLSSTSVVVIVNCVHVIGETQANQYSLKMPPGVTAQGFFDNYGDSFVSAIVLGGQYYAAFVFDSTSTEEQTQISAQLSGSAGTLSASLSATLSSASSATSTTMRMSQKVMGIEKPPALPGDANGIVQFALSFGSLTIDSPQVLCFAVTGYEHVMSNPAFFTAVVTNRNLLGTASLTPFIDATNVLAALSGQVASIQQMYTAYGYTGDSQFATNAAQTAADQKSLAALIANIENNVTATYAAPALPSLGLGTPMPSFALNPTTAPAELNYPGLTVVPFFDLTPSQVAAGTKPASITLLGQNPVSGISVVYSDGTSVTHGTSSSTVGPLTIAANDSIANVSMLIDNPVFALYIETASGQSLGPSLPPSSPPSFVFSAPPAIIGFAGNVVSDTLTNLVPIAVTVSDAVWITRQPASLVRRATRASQQVQAHA